MCLLLSAEDVIPVIVCTAFRLSGTKATKQLFSHPLESKNNKWQACAGRLGQVSDYARADRLATKMRNLKTIIYAVMCGSCLYIWDRNLLLGIMQISCLMLSHHLKQNHQARVWEKAKSDKYLSKQLFISTSVSLNGHNSCFKYLLKQKYVIGEV